MGDHKRQGGLIDAGHEMEARATHGQDARATNAPAISEKGDHKFSDCSIFECRLLDCQLLGAVAY